MNMRDRKMIQEQVSVTERISLGETVLMPGSLGLVGLFTQHLKRD